MRVILFLVLILGSLSAHAVGYFTSHRVAHQMIQVYKQHYDVKVTVKFEVLPFYNNASVRSCGIRTICIDTGARYISQFNQAQWAAIMGHELGHYHLRHLWKKHSKALELAADVFGQELAAKAGYDPCQIKKYWIKRSFDGDKHVYKISTHPAPSVRAKNLRCNV